jgi:hypothetical protein
MTQPSVQTTYRRVDGVHLDDNETKSLNDGLIGIFRGHVPFDVIEEHYQDGVVLRHRVIRLGKAEKCEKCNSGLKLVLSGKEDYSMIQVYCTPCYGTGIKPRTNFIWVNGPFC